MLIGTHPLRAYNEILGDQPEWMRIKSLTYSKSEPLDVGELIVTLGSKRRKDYWFPVHWWVYEKFVRLAQRVSRLGALRYLQRYIRKNYGYRGKWPDSFYYKAYHIVRDPVVVKGSRAGAGKWPVSASQGFQTGVKTLAKLGPNASPTAMKDPMKVGKELLRRDAEYAKDKKLGRNQVGGPRPFKGKEALMPNTSGALIAEETSDYDEPILAAAIAGRVGLSIHQVGQALAMFRSGKTIESVAHTLGVPSTLAELTQRLLASYGNGLKMNEKIDSMIEAIEDGEDPDEVAGEDPFVADADADDSEPTDTDDAEDSDSSEEPAKAWTDETIAGDLTGAIMAFESGEMDDDSVVALFQNLVNSGLAWKLQGSYGRAAKALIDQGLVTDPTARSSSAEESKLAEAEVTKKTFEAVAAALLLTKASRETVLAVGVELAKLNPLFKLDVFVDWATKGPPKTRPFAKGGEWDQRMAADAAPNVESKGRLVGKAGAKQ